MEINEKLLSEDDRDIFEEKENIEESKVLELMEYEYINSLINDHKRVFNYILSLKKGI